VILLALLLQAEVLAAAPPAPPPDWDAMPELPVLRRTTTPPQLSYFVRTEVDAGRCDAATGSSLSVELAVLVSANGQIRGILPRAIGCATVEQYASGIASRQLRGNVAAPGVDSWYRTTISFLW
jgi:hypothetical protein